MPGIPQVRKTGPRTYTPAELVLGGQVVEGRTGTPGKFRVGVAGAGSNKTLGVALLDAINPEAIVTTPVNGVLNAAPLTSALPVADSGIEVPVTYAADANFGDRLIAAANGAVTPAGAAPDARQIVGKCSQPGGVVVATKATGLMITA